MRARWLPLTPDGTDTQVQSRMTEILVQRGVNGGSVATTADQYRRTDSWHPDHDFG